MNYRIAEILAPQDIGEFGTLPFDITLADVISRIDVIFRTRNGSSDWADHPAANVQKIELIDGSDVLESLTGREIQALNFYDRKLSIDNHMTGSNGEYMRASFGLDFGRYLYDPELAFDPKKFTNPQLKITWDEDVANTDCSINSLMIIASIFDELKPTPVGFLMNKELYSYTPAGNANEYIDLPTDYPMRKLLIGSLQSGKTFSQMIAEMRLSEDSDKRVPWDITGDELFWEMKRIYPPHVENVYHAIDTSDTNFYVTPAEDAILQGHSTSTAQALMMYFGNGGLVTAKFASAKETAYLRCMGYIPHGYASIPFGDPGNIDNWYDVTKLGSLQLRVKAGVSLGSNPTTQVIAQQIRRYA